MRLLNSLSGRLPKRRGRLASWVPWSMVWLRNVTFAEPLMWPRRPQLRGPLRCPFFSEKVHVDLLFSDDLIVLHTLDLYSRYSLLVPARPKNPVEVWDAFCASWIAGLGRPEIAQMD